MKFQEKTGITGCFRMQVYRRGKLIEEYQDNNLIVTGARSAMAHLIAGNGTGKQISRIAFGTSLHAPTPDDTAITDAYSKAVGGFSYPLAGQVEVQWELQATEANGKSIAEFGLILADGTLFARKIRQNPIYKDADISIDGAWLIIF